MHKERDMEKMRIAVPSNSPGGMSADRSDHFGHCDLFTIIDIEAGSVVKVDALENITHAAGGCMVPVKLLQERAVNAIVVGGMGARPLQGFHQAGIDVYFAPAATFGDVQSVVDGMLAESFPVMNPDQVCQGGGNCHH
jgi:predicted Fe-Mo cluster-binding NifX family protein